MTTENETGTDNAATTDEANEPVDETTTAPEDAAEASVEAVYETPQSRPRGILALGLALAIAITGVGSLTYASLTVETVREGNAITGEAKAGLVFTDESGVIRKDISPDQAAEEFSVTATNVGNISGHAALSAPNLDVANFTDGFLDNTRFTISALGDDNRWVATTVTLRQFATNGFVPAHAYRHNSHLIEPAENVEYRITVTPPTSAENFTAADLRAFSQEFILAFTFSAADSSGNSDLYRGAEQLNNRVGEFYLIPLADLANISANGVSETTVGG
ncbi:hypothetical protein [Microbacterium sp. SORGH_AS_0888]|uniref:hypothetical protein n=1 Tax=Microbacterium sp. SORGH_AS_0888 TaxID=3041791 RepID=UPI0027832899|nr:hypothetical protein [Microbacterium sp. SORGH_AS_0888]MDQ1130948.1 hypothetical protein [Microbacterium sp. SORGH_AS_0888]